jgi:hypothetical protein
MVNITHSFGGMPVYFLRFNPDDYASFKGSPEAIAKRHELLFYYIRDIHEGTVSLPTALLSVFYMYFDGWKTIRDETWTVILPFS